MKQPVSNDFNRSFSLGQTYSARTIYHMMRPARASPGHFKRTAPILPGPHEVESEDEMVRLAMMFTANVNADAAK